LQYQELAKDNYFKKICYYVYLSIKLNKEILMSLTKQYLAISETGAISDKTLIEPGVTVMSGTNILDKYIRIKLHEVDLTIDAQATVEFKLGSVSIFKRSLNQNGEIHALDRDMGLVENLKGSEPLTMSIVGTANVTGFIRWSWEWAGGNRALKAQDTYGEEISNTAIYN
jgi:hypothetical protein